MTSKGVLPRNSGSANCGPNHTTRRLTPQVCPAAACHRPPEQGRGQVVDGIAEAASVAQTIARSDTKVDLRTTVRTVATRSSTTGEAAPSWSAAH